MRSIYFLIHILLISPCSSVIDSTNEAYLAGNLAHRNGNATLAMEMYRLAVTMDPQNYFGQIKYSI